VCVKYRFVSLRTEAFLCFAFQHGFKPTFSSYTHRKSVHYSDVVLQFTRTMCSFFVHCSGVIRVSRLAPTSVGLQLLEKPLYGASDKRRRSHNAAAATAARGQVTSLRQESVKLLFRPRGVGHTAFGHVVKLHSVKICGLSGTHRLYKCEQTAKIFTTGTQSLRLWYSDGLPCQILWLWVKRYEIT